MSSPTGNDKSGFKSGDTLILKKKKPDHDTRALKEAKDEEKNDNCESDADLHKLNSSLNTLVDSLEQIRDRLVLMNEMVADQRHTEHAENMGIDTKTIH